ncbi:kinase-like domain-containing protein [Ochromonadaceae sp. CCMP2298]|nr:kinase-like domain-containing protein [Ochromonadaceae sp. CCMP2298]
MRIEKIVGSGTFGVVYKAVDKTDPQMSEVALKRIKMERETQGFPVTAIREIKLLTLMRNHPNIVHLREIDFENGDVFMVFEFVDYDLSGLLKAGSMPLTDQHIRCYLHQLLLGTACLHEADILHRDIKSANLLVTKHNVLKIADWGLARALPHDAAASAKLTNPVVTLWYRSPEVIVGSKKYDKGVDVWSVGCIFGEMKTRVAMFRGETEPAQLDLIFQLTGLPQGPALQQYEALEQWSSMKLGPHKDSFQAKYGDSGKRGFDAQALDLLRLLLDIDPARRITAQAALQHPYFTEHEEELDPSR